MPRSVPRRRLFGTLVAAALLLGAAAPVASAAEDTAELPALTGWFDYAPLSDDGVPMSFLPAFGRPEPRPAA
ncbi:hypothetical protein [Kitasatospora sp. NPDC057223]|uniref:hypothetical protein n=1 Tax=Kitasatospora sp. NPDC057223 TaxID=3346055 RepID=UPI003629A728